MNSIPLSMVCHQICAFSEVLILRLLSVGFKEGGRTLGNIKIMERSKENILCSSILERELQYSPDWEIDGTGRSIAYIFDKLKREPTFIQNPE